MFCQGNKEEQYKRESETWEHWQDLFVSPNFGEISGLVLEAKAIARTIVMKAPITHLHLILSLFVLFFSSDSPIYHKLEKDPDYQNLVWCPANEDKTRENSEQCYVLMTRTLGFFFLQC